MQQGFTGPFRSGSTMDYPSPQNYLEPLYSTSALPRWREPVVLEEHRDDRHVLEEDVLGLVVLRDGLVALRPVEQSVFSEHVSDVTVDIFGRVEAPKVTVND
jgi:oligopeptide transport system substrate-binding protein